MSDQKPPSDSSQPEQPGIRVTPDVVDVVNRPYQASGMRLGLEFCCGVMLPSLTFFVELTSRMCAGEFFDPMPTPWHYVLVALVPCANFAAFLWTPQTARGKRILRLLMGISLGVSIVYSLVFLPLMPIAVPAILFAGLGLLPLTPFLAALASLSLRLRLAREHGPAAQTRYSNLLVAFAMVFLLFLLPEIPEAVTRYGAHSATHGTREEKLAGVRFLRRFGSRDAMLRYCYRDGSLGLWRNDRMFGTGAETQALRVSNVIDCDVTPAEMRDLVYRVTGKTYSSFPRPSRGWRRDDEDLGGTSVASRVEALAMDSSRMDVAVHRDSLTTYTEWTMVFRNDDASFAKEARAQIVLPPDGVVSRLTLWIHGEPCEAAFGSSQSVRSAYESVAVEQRRDPVLVTYAGVDRVLMQCFPVPSTGTMKVRIGFTAPLYPDDGSAEVLLPYLAETNFKDKSATAVWFTGEVNGDGVSRVSGGTQGQFPSDQLSSARFEVPCSGGDAIRVANPVDTEQTIVQTTRRIPVDPRRFVFVVDESLSMHEYLEDIGRALESVDASKPDIVLAGDEITQPDSADSISDALTGAAVSGGCNNGPAILKAWDLAEQTPATDIIWFHGPQPLKLGDLNQLNQRFEYGDKITLHSFNVTGGPNRLFEQLPTSARVQTHRPDPNDLTASLALLHATSRMVIDRTVEPTSAEAAADEPVQGADHVVRLWANDQVDRQLAAANRAEATRLGIAHRLVTPVSGAVVLENQAQYDAAGLEPVDPYEVPTIPEPEVWMMLVVGLIMIVVVSRKRRRVQVATQ